MSDETVHSDVAGTVWKIEKTVGDAVQADDVIMILESMKMEIPVVAPRAGVIAEILVDEAGPVNEGEALVRLSA
ncbi:MAG: acetyl-CoA carboxylase biotin carboxyl carrier protein subunit [Burkholderiaceae bacterium]